MSTTTTPPASPLPTESFLTPQFIIALFGMTIAALAGMAVMLLKDMNAIQGGMAGTLIAGGMLPMTFYFGSSKGSQDKDARAASQSAPAPTPGTP